MPGSPMTCVRCGADDCGRRGSLPVLRRLRHARSPHADPAAGGRPHVHRADAGCRARRLLLRARASPSATATRWSRRSAPAGMGQVYKAIDRKLGKTVALKLIRPDTAAQQEGLRAVPARAGAGAGRHASQRVPRARPGRGGRRRLHQHGVRRGAEPGGPDPVGRPPLAEADRAPRAPDLRRAPGHPRARHRPPRPQAREHHGGPLGPRAGDGLRHGLPQRAGAADRRGRGAGHAGLPLARAGARPAHRPALGHLRGGARALRDAHGAPAARRPVERAPGPARRRRALPAAEPVRPRGPGGARHDRHAVPGARARARRFPTAVALEEALAPRRPPPCPRASSGVRPLARPAAQGRGRSSAAVVLAAAASSAGWRWWRERESRPTPAARRWSPSCRSRTWAAIPATSTSASASRTA